jgi:Xaa-Pro aminopeptidase
LPRCLQTAALIDPRRITYGFREAIPASVTVVEAINPSVFQVEKNSGEAQLSVKMDGTGRCRAV